MIERYKKKDRASLVVQPVERARRFLAALDPTAKEFCFQVFDDNPDRQLRNNKLAGCHTSTLDEAWDWLVKVNGKGAGVFVAINETNGVGRTKKDVTRVRAVLLDLDGKPLDAVKKCWIIRCRPVAFDDEGII